MKIVFDANRKEIGFFDGEFVFDKKMNHLYRFDGDEVYSMDTPCKYIGEFSDYRCLDNKGSLIFQIP